MFYMSRYLLVITPSPQAKTQSVYWSDVQCCLQVSDILPESPGTHILRQDPGTYIHVPHTALQCYIPGSLMGHPRIHL